MKQVQPYLIFSGTCKDALAFYADCFDGEIVVVQTYADSPMEVPELAKERIFNAEFRAEGVNFMASDDMPGDEVTIGGNFAMFVAFTDPIEQQTVFTKLSANGHIQFPLNNGFGMLVDQFGVQWMLAASE